MNDVTIAIELRDITKVYKNGGLEVPVLHGLTLQHRARRVRRDHGAVGLGQVHADEHHRLPGPRDHRPLSCSTAWTSRISSDNELAAIRLRKLGFVFQGFNLLARTDALKNVALPLFYAGVPTKLRNQRAQAALARSASPTAPTTSQTSSPGGQQQRVAIARALINDPAVLLADEPTGNLDSKTSAEIMALFANLHEGGRTIIMVTHDPERRAAGASG